jgi:Domain of unknown function (DUF4936)
MVTARPGHLYVYYRVVRDSAAARAAVAALFADVEARTGVAGRLLARADDPATWMEVYEPVARPAAFARLLAARARRHGVEALARDGRHVEHFRALPPRRTARRAA